LNITTRVAVTDVPRAVDSVEALVPETIDKVLVLAAPTSTAVVPAAAAVVEVATAAAEDLVEEAMEAFTTMMDMVETITPRELTGGVTELALPNKLIWKPHVT
jgi:hypothetical protein